MLIKPGYAGMSFDLPDDAIIADIGSGHNPLPEATYCVERDMGESPERSGLATVIPDNPRCRLIIADVSRGIPLPDKSCDFVVASHILEHVDDPVSFCRELERVGKSGYIETPGPWQEWVNNKQVHKWIVSTEDGILIFRKKTQFRNEPSWKIAVFVIDLIEYNLFRQTIYHWIGKIPCEVRE